MKAKNKFLNVKDGKLYHRNQQCVYNITSRTGYVNLSVTKLTYSGYLFGDEGRTDLYKCNLGGVAFNKETGKGYVFQTICDNYTSSDSVQKTGEKILMNIISPDRDGWILVMYSYKHYSLVSVEAKVIPTPCKGVFKRQFFGKNYRTLCKSSCWSL